MSVTLPALAELEDIEGSDGFSPDQRIAARSALDRARTVVRNYTHRKFTTQSFTHRIRPIGHWLRLSQTPVISVESVGLFVFGQITLTTGWIWDGLDKVYIGSLGMVINLSEDLMDALAYGVNVAEVTYTAGYELVPDDIVTVVAGLASRALALPQDGTIIQQTAGPFSFTVASWANGGPLSLSDADKAMLKPYRRGSRTIELGV